MLLVLVPAAPVFGQSKTKLVARPIIESEVQKTKETADSLLSLPSVLVEKSQNKIDSLKQTVRERSPKTEELSTIISSPSGVLGENATVVNGIPNLHELVNESDIGSSINKVKTEAGNYENDFSERSKGSVQQVKEAPLYLENKIKNLEEVEGLERMKTDKNENFQMDVGESEGLDPNKLDDSDYLKEQVATQFTKHATEYFAKHNDQLKAAQGKLAKLKNKYGSLISMKNPPKKKENPLKGKTLGERLTVGGNFQLYKTQPFGVDVSPQLAYQLTKKFSMGVGGTYRTGFNKEKDFLFTKEKEAYGFRAYSEHDVYKSFYAHVEFERMYEKNFVEVTSDLPTTKWNSNALLGIGKTYHFTKGIKGNVMVLYNFLNDKTNPYRRPWNIRFGFELKNKKLSYDKEEKELKQ